MSGLLHPPGPLSAAPSQCGVPSSGAAPSPGSAPSSGSASSSGSAPPGSVPLLTPAQAAALLDQVVYEQVLECVDLDALYHVAQSLDSMVGEIEGVPDDRVGQVARSMLDRALLRLPDDLRGYLRISELAARDGCILCEVEARQAAGGRGCVTATGGERRSKRPHS
jgi:hypothetical protein